ncbi:MAG: nucleotidyltransferase domain-containing protein [Nanoarchaeota archaeon]|nr:nucleotidyltransferase domain-containing protein [Nanoarchaeota archaeon]
MLKKYNRYLLLKIFLDSPTDSFRLRELSRLSKISPASVMNYLKEFEDEGLIRKYEKRGVPFYKADRDDEDFVFYKKISILYELKDSGLVDYLWDNLHPEAIILYGSYAKGESTEESDIDFFIVGKEKNINLRKFEDLFKREIHLMFEKDSKKIPKKLKSNLVNGVVLKGYFNI